MSVAAKTKEHSARVTRELKFLCENRETCVTKNLDETVRLQSEKRQEWIRQVGGKRQQRIADGTSSAGRLANSSGASFPERNGCPGTYCCLIVKGEREDSSCQIFQRV